MVRFVECFRTGLLKRLVDALEYLMIPTYYY